MTSPNSPGAFLFGLRLMALDGADEMPTLSAGRKILIAAKAAHYHRPQSIGGKVLTD